ncbi:MAG: sensor domain-containing protein [Saccharospirillum sp.]
MSEGFGGSLAQAAFEQHPAPQLVCRPSGVVLMANAAMRQANPALLGDTSQAHLSTLAPALLDHIRTLVKTSVVPVAGLIPDSLQNVQLTPLTLAEGIEAVLISATGPVTHSPQQHQLSALFEHSLDAIAYTSPDGVFQLANQAFLDMLGHAADDVLGRSFRDFTPDSDLAREDDLNPDALFNDGVSDIYDKHFIRKDGSLVPVSIRLALVRDAQGNPEGVWSVSRDSSLRNQLIESLTRSERRFRALFRNSLDAIGYWSHDHHLQYANQAYLDMIGYQQHELAGLTYRDFTPEGWEEVDQIIAEQIAERGYSDAFEKEIRHRDGHVIPISIRASALQDNDGRIVGSWVIIRDISHYKDAQNQLEHSQQLLKLTNRMARVGGWEYNPATRTFGLTDEAYRILAIPRAYNLSIGSLSKLFDLASQKALVSKIRETLANAYPTDFDIQLDGFDPQRWLKVTAERTLDSAGQPYLIGALQDISEFKARQHSLEQDRDNYQQMAFHDPLTQLPNRLLLEDRFRQLIYRADRNQTYVAVIVIDLDNFKLINDQLGHPAGDALLKAIATRLRRSVRQSDTVARLGGDEFIVLAALSSAEESKTVANKLFRELQQPIDWEGQPLNSQCSMGLAVYPAMGNTFDALYEAADRAMYKAKADGKNQMQVYSTEP